LAAVGARRSTRLNRGHGARRERQCRFRFELDTDHVRALRQIGRDDRPSLAGRLAGDRFLVVLFVVLVFFVVLGQLSSLDDNPLAVAVPAKGERAHPEMLDDRLVELGLLVDRLGADCDATLAKREQQRGQALREHGHLCFLQRDRHDPVTLGGL
jgi:hypothetical protein